MGIEEVRRKIKRKIGEVRRILIVRLSSFGDMVHSMHAAAGLKAALPQAEIGWLTSEKFAGLARCAGFVDNVHVINTSGGPFKSIWAAFKMRGELAGRYDIAVDVQGLLKSAVAARRAGAGVLGYAGKESREGSGLFYRWRIEPSDAARHVVEKQAELLSVLVPVTPVRRIDLKAADDDARKTAERFPWAAEGGFAVVHRHTRWPTKDLAEKLTVATVRMLEKKGRQVVATAGDEKEGELLKRLLDGSHARIVSGLSLVELVWLYSRSGLYIGPDTGPTHLASALGIPSVAVYGPTDPVRNRPYGPRTVVIRPAGDDCKPCWKRSCPEDGKVPPRCLSGITLEDVAEATDSALSMKEA